jgi:DNA-binding winged helix-turn-helix (wHTH) protein
MPIPNETARLARFGVFELDLETGELRRKGVKIRLQEQPFRVLAMLVERPGELVTRNRLRARLWPDAVFVDFDHGLNKAVAKIRRALGDLADSPRYVETLERRGYRFIAPVEVAAAGLRHEPPGGSLPGPPPGVVRLVWGDRSIPLGDGVHLIGRDPGVAVWIDSSTVSRQHARLSVAGATITIEDLGSHNGTFVNGHRVDAVSSLSHGDEIRIGPASFAVRSAAAAAKTRTATDDHLPDTSSTNRK